MSRTNYRSTSPYSKTPQSSWYLDIMEPINIVPDETDDFIVVEAKYENRPDLLSYDLYGTTDYWWVFMVRNMNEIKDPIFDLKAGMTIFVPSVNKLSRSKG